MFKKILIPILVLVLLVVVTTTVLAGPPWPATVFNPVDESCYNWWVDKEGNPFILWGTFQGVYQEKNGNWKVTCHNKIDFDDPGVATIPEACEMYPQYLHCNGNGSITFHEGTCYFLDQETDQNFTVLNPNGNYNTTCHFNGNQIEP